MGGSAGDVTPTGAGIGAAVIGGVTGMATDMVQGADTGPGITPAGEMPAVMCITTGVRESDKATMPGPRAILTIEPVQAAKPIICTPTGVAMSIREIVKETSITSRTINNDNHRQDRVRAKVSS